MPILTNAGLKPQVAKNVMSASDVSIKEDRAPKEETREHERIDRLPCLFGSAGGRASITQAARKPGFNMSSTVLAKFLFPRPRRLPAEAQCVLGPKVWPVIVRRSC